MPARDPIDRLNFCKQALGELGTRSTITSIDPPDGSQEAYYCNLFFDGTRDQILRAAHWSFAKRTDPASLWKALPGTPENQTIPSPYIWTPRYPAPPWLYSYVYPATVCIQVRQVYAQSSALSETALYPDQYGGTTAAEPFEIGIDRYDRAGNDLLYTRRVADVTINNAGSGYRPSDYITLVGDTASLMGTPTTLHVTSVSTVGGVTTAGVNEGGTYVGTGTINLTQSSTTGVGFGFTCTPALLIESNPNAKVILTNARDALFEYTTSYVQVYEYDSLFADAFMLALEGKLALALLGDRSIYGAKLQEANNSIINARVRDGNEGLTRYEHVPDWLQVRGVSAMNQPWFNPPYGPLFAV